MGKWAWSSEEKTKGFSQSQMSEEKFENFWNPPPPPKKKKRKEKQKSNMNFPKKS